MSTSAPSGRSRDQRSLDTLGTQLRPVILALAGGAVLMIVVVLLTFTETGTAVELSAVLVFGLPPLVAAWLLPTTRLKPLDPGQRADPAEAARTLRTSSMLALALAETPVLVGVVVSFVVGAWMPAMVGGILATAALLSLGPTRSRLDLWKDRLEANGARTGL
ncbi:hypothetical protein [Phytoactinopolyspora mesophila]|uniref:Uncharacterized protein n=1 Tax=Phytoactinopolyspora mesophila TaxID=2650750 RepID=A0A7K3M3F3_9ACTN|nr:hypothetical protein [Phytoactinopolyspora mesophila]NDL56978.1 hypothetical protein [Phytoactinopolyspora mesophila]